MARKRDRAVCKMVSTEGTGIFYMGDRNPKKKPTKMKWRKYDPKLRKHVSFKEEKA